jgi:hypothetical protein
MADVSFTMRRWIAALCVAMLVFVALGHMHNASAQPAQGAAYSQSHSQPNDGDQQGSAIADHCCCAHNTVEPPSSESCTVHQTSRETKAPRSDASAPLRAPLGLERPPKASASF